MPHPGALQTIQALVESEVDIGRTGLVSWSLKGCSDVLNMTSINDDPEWARCRDNFLSWRAFTGNIFVPGLLILYRLASILLIVATMVVLGIKFQAGDTDEILFPPHLEIKRGQTLKSHTAKNAKGGELSLAEVEEFHFVRARESTREFMVSMGVLLGIPLGFITTYFWGSRDFTFMATVALLIGPAFGVMMSVYFGGLATACNNATTLSNWLVRLNRTSLSAEVRSQRFKVWMEFYKTSVGALHVWSWRMTPLFASLFTLVAIIAYYTFLIISLFTTIISEPDIIQSRRFAVFQALSTRQVHGLIFTTSILLAFVLAISLVATRYQRLHNLVAIINLPEQDLQAFNAVILMQQKPALTIYDRPITSTTAIMVLRLLFVQNVLICLNLMS
jgi:hypothetical protein